MSEKVLHVIESGVHQVKALYKLVNEKGGEPWDDGERGGTIPLESDAVEISRMFLADTMTDAETLCYDYLQTVNGGKVTYFEPLHIAKADSIIRYKEE